RPKRAATEVTEPPAFSAARTSPRSCAESARRVRRGSSVGGGVYISHFLPLPTSASPSTPRASARRRWRAISIRWLGGPAEAGTAGCQGVTAGQAPPLSAGFEPLIMRVNRTSPLAHEASLDRGTLSVRGFGHDLCPARS